MPDNTETLTLNFRCPAELDGKLPPPIRRRWDSGLAQGHADAEALDAINMREEDTIKRCPPFVDAMTSGF